MELKRMSICGGSVSFVALGDIVVAAPVDTVAGGAFSLSFSLLISPADTVVS